MALRRSPHCPTAKDIMDCPINQLREEIRLSSQVIPDDDEESVGLSCDDMGAVVEDKKPAALSNVECGPMVAGYCDSFTIAIGRSSHAS